MFARHLIRTACLSIGLLTPTIASAQAAPPDTSTRGKIVEVEGVPNTPRQQKKHYVVLVSLDGFRYDYPQEWGAPNIAELARTGATAPDGMLPSYPSITFPNHVTLVTGLYPEHHGIVSNVFYDPVRRELYSYTSPQTNSDGAGTKARRYGRWPSNRECEPHRSSGRAPRQ